MLVADVVEDQDDALDAAVVVLDGCGTVVDGACRAVPGGEDGVVGEADDDAVAEHLGDGVLGRLAGVLIGDAEDLRQGLARRLVARPAGERLGDRVEEGDAALGVGGDDARRRCCGAWW